jgi:AraC-like DNA-binding protein/quercetin dioxygenase-like cupin family protein
MSPNSQRVFPPETSVIVANFRVAPDAGFEWHTHPEHQLAWAPTGVLIVHTHSGSYVLPPTRALWIPSGTEHETLAAGEAIMRAAYLRPDRAPITWPEPTPVLVTPLLAELIAYLDHASGTSVARRHAEGLLYDLVRPIATTTIDLPLPTDPRARDVAEALRANPRDHRNLKAWGHQVGASERTLARTFVASTGLSFARWRTLVRLQTALPLLAEGHTVAIVADRVGYETPSAFVAAFRRETGITPGRYFTTS